jgi:hypothetical protein
VPPRERGDVLMWDILMAYLGKRTCPWCNIQKGYDETWYERIYNKLPLWLVKNLGPYDTWVGEVGGGHHRKTHNAATRD